MYWQGVLRSFQMLRRRCSERPSSQWHVIRNVSNSDLSITAYVRTEMNTGRIVRLFPRTRVTWKCNVFESYQSHMFGVEKEHLVIAQGGADILLMSEETLVQNQGAALASFH